MDINDVIISLGGVEQILKASPINPTDEELQFHIDNNVIGNRPSLQAVKDKIAYFEANPPIAKEPIPTLNQRQIRFVLNAAGLRETVEAMVAQADQYTKDWWEFSEEYKHDHPVLVQMAGQLSLTSEQVEQMFRDGALM